MITENKKFKLLFMIFSLVCIIAVGVCLIVDMATGAGLFWSGLVFCGVVFLWAVVSPLLLAKKRKVLCALIAASIAALLLLYFVGLNNYGIGWLAQPVTLGGIVACWITFFVLKYLKINKWYLSAIVFALFGVVYNILIEYHISAFIERSMFSWDNMIDLLACIAITALLAIVGYYSDIRADMSKKKTAENQPEKHLNNYLDEEKKEIQ
jgi:hypothetical protein